MTAQVQLLALNHLFGDAPTSSREVAKNPFIAKSAAVLAKAEQQSLRTLIDRLEAYDAEDRDGFTFLVKQVAHRVVEEQTLAAALGVHPATLSRWISSRSVKATSKSNKAPVPPVYARRPLIVAMAEILRHGLENIDTHYRKLNEITARAAVLEPVRRKVAS